MGYRTTMEIKDYKEVVKFGKASYKIRYDKEDIDENFCTCMEHIFKKYKPEMQEIKSIIIDYYNDKAHKDIVEGMTYTTVDGVTIHPYLSSENQMNYKNAFDLEMIPYTIKNQNGYEPEYYTFMNIEQFSQFYYATVQHVKNELQNAWETKDNIDWTKYEIEDEPQPNNSGVVIEETSIYSNNETVNEEDNVEDIQA